MYILDTREGLCYFLHPLIWHRMTRTTPSRGTWSQSCFDIYHSNPFFPPDLFSGKHFANIHISAMCHNKSCFRFVFRNHMPRTTNSDKIKIVHVACDVATHLPQVLKLSGPGVVRIHNTLVTAKWRGFTCRWYTFHCLGYKGYKKWITKIDYTFLEFFKARFEAVTF